MTKLNLRKCIRIGKHLPGFFNKSSAAPRLRQTMLAFKARTVRNYGDEGESGKLLNFSVSRPPTPATNTNTNINRLFV